MATAPQPAGHLATPAGGLGLEPREGLAALLFPDLGRGGEELVPCDGRRVETPEGRFHGDLLRSAMIASREGSEVPPLMHRYQ
jgi:hypothetical protein